MENEKKYESPFIVFKIEEIKSPLIAVCSSRDVKTLWLGFFLRFFLTKGGLFSSLCRRCWGEVQVRAWVGRRRDQDLLKRDRGHGTGSSFAL